MDAYTTLKWKVTLQSQSNPMDRTGVIPAEWTKRELIQNYIKDTCLEKTVPMPLVVLFGTKSCPRSHDMTVDLDCAKTSHYFEWQYYEIPRAVPDEVTFAEELGVRTRDAPAMLVLHDILTYTVYQSLSDNVVIDIIKLHCHPRPKGILVPFFN